MFAGEPEQFKSFIQVFIDMPRHENGLPIRSHFQPMQHTHLLPWMSIAEWHDSNSITLKLLGENLRMVTGGASIGTNVYDIYDESQLTTFRELHGAAVSTPFIYKLFRNVTKSDGTHLQTTSYSIPTTTEDGKRFYIYSIMYIGGLEAMTEADSHWENVSLSEKIYLVDMGNGIPDTLNFEYELDTLLN